MSASSFTQSVSRACRSIKPPKIFPTAGAIRRIARSKSSLNQMNAAANMRRKGSLFVFAPEDIGDTSLTPWYCFKDKRQQQRFKKFTRGDFDPALFGTFLVFYSLLYIPAMSSSFWSISNTSLRDFDGNHLFLASNLSLEIISTVLIFCLLLFPGFLVLYLRVIKSIYHPSNSFEDNNNSLKKKVVKVPPKLYTALSHWEPSIEKVFIVGACFAQGLSLLTRVYRGSCSDAELSGNFALLFCNPQEQTHTLPQESAFTLVLFPFFLVQAICGISWRAAILSWFLAFVMLAVCISVAGAWAQSGILLMFMLFDGGRMLMIHRQNIAMFLSVQAQKRALALKLEAENKATQALEMRNLISNMAHDLKSPLQAFSNSLTDLENNISQIFESPDILSESIQDGLDSCVRTVEDMTTTSHFMTMAINRALDYSKASHGIKLIPTYRNVDLMETIGWPIRCMKNLQDRIAIILHPIPEAIFPYCITDRQWLQENMLCVLSNAVKFSFGGTVEITVSLVEEKKRRAGSAGSLGEMMSARKGGVSQDGTSSPAATTTHQMLRFQVVDTGIGISPEAQEAAFHPLKRSATDRHSGGAGLGLYSLSKRVEALGGSCGIGPRKDGTDGTLVWFTEPYRPDFSPTTEEGEPIDVSPESLLRLRSRRPSDGGMLMAQSSLRRRVDGSSLSKNSTRVAHHASQSPPRGPPSDVFSWANALPAKAAATVEKIASRVVSFSAGSSLSRNTSQLGITARSPAGNYAIPANVVEGPEHSSQHSMRPGSEEEYSIGAKPGDSEIVPITPPRQITVLLVDDSPTILKTMSRTLQRANYEVDTASNGAIALEMMKKGCYDAVVMDIQMPVMDGIDAAKLLREHEEWVTANGGGIGPDGLPVKRQLVIGVSANSDPETSVKALDAGMDRFVPKPFTVKMFESILQGDLLRKQTTEESRRERDRINFDATPPQTVNRFGAHTQHTRALSEPHQHMSPSWSPAQELVVLQRHEHDDGGTSPRRHDDHMTTIDRGVGKSIAINIINRKKVASAPVLGALVKESMAAASETVAAAAATVGGGGGGGGARSGGVSHEVRRPQGVTTKTVFVAVAAAANQRQYKSSDALLSLLADNHHNHVLVNSSGGSVRGETQQEDDTSVSGPRSYESGERFPSSGTSSSVNKQPEVLEQILNPLPRVSEGSEMKEQQSQFSSRWSKK